MKKIILPLLATFMISLIIACGGADEKKARKEIEKMDSISAEMEKTIENLEQKTKELEEEVDQILEDLE